MSATAKWRRCRRLERNGKYGGMAGMEGMSGTGSGTVMVSPEKQQLLGVRTAAMERRPLVKTVRTVGTITYDETKITHVHSKIEGWIDKLYVNYTGKLVEKGQPLFTIYSPDLLATQQEYLLAIKAKERLSTSSIPEVRSGAVSLSRPASDGLPFGISRKIRFASLRRRARRREH